MIKVYKRELKSKTLDLVILNDIFFNKVTVELLDDDAANIIESIDHSVWINKYQFKSRFDSSVLNIDKLSTGCKTALNIMYNPDKIFNICECGDNALDVIYSLTEGNVYCAYPFISFDMKKVIVCDEHGEHEIDDYEELKEWWTNEN